MSGAGSVVRENISGFLDRARQRGRDIICYPELRYNREGRCVATAHGAFLRMGDVVWTEHALGDSEGKIVEIFQGVGGVGAVLVILLTVTDGAGRIVYQGRVRRAPREVVKTFAVTL